MNNSNDMKTFPSHASNLLGACYNLNSRLLVENMPIGSMGGYIYLHEWLISIW